MAGANRLYWPRHGSMQFWHRSRAKRQHPRIRTWVEVDASKVVGFMGYKVGMTHVLIRDNNPKSLTKGQNVALPVTIVECPSLKPIALRFYTVSVDGLKLVSEIFSDKLDKAFKKPKTQGKEIADFADLRLVVHTQPKTTDFGKKKPDVFELPLNGKTNEEKLKLGKELLNKEIKIQDVFKEGQYVDVHGVTKGKGYQGTVKRFGVKIRQHKSEKTKRGVGTLGSWRPKKVSWRVAQAGKMGYHTRTEFNKWLLKMITDPKAVNPKGGFLHYGMVKNDVLLIKGSIPGPAKRAIMITEAARPTRRKSEVAEVKFISTASKQ